MRQYVGKDIREVVIDSGPPINAMDMGDGVRAFQFKWGGGAAVVPGSSTTTGSVSAVGNRAWYSSNTVSAPGGVFVSEGCVITYMTRWSAADETWVVHAYRAPKQLVC